MLIYSKQLCLAEQLGQDVPQLLRLLHFMLWPFDRDVLRDEGAPGKAQRGARQARRREGCEGEGLPIPDLGRLWGHWHMHTL